MVESSWTRFFLTEKKLLKLQLHLCAGNGTFHNTNTCRQHQDATLSVHQHVHFSVVTDGTTRTYSLSLSLCFSAATVVAPVSVSPVLRVFVAPVFSYAPTPAAALLPAAPVVAYTHIQTRLTWVKNCFWR